MILQVFIDHQELLQNLKAGTSDKCCFKNHDITTTNVVFQSEDDAASIAGTLFVRIMFHNNEPIANVGCRCTHTNSMYYFQLGTLMHILD